MIQMRMFSIICWIAALIAVQVVAFHGHSRPTNRRLHSSALRIRKDEGSDGIGEASESRRSFLVASGLAPLVTQVEPASAAKWLGRKTGLYVIDDRSAAEPKEQVDTPIPVLSSEYALLKTLPVRNPVFRTLEQSIEKLSVFRDSGKCYQSSELIDDVHLTNTYFSLFLSRGRRVRERGHG